MLEKAFPKLFFGLVAAASMSGLILTGCQKPEDNATKTGSAGGGNSSGTGSDQKGEVVIDGSSTVFPISERIAEEYKSTSPDVKVSVSESGSGGGFKKFAAGEIDIADASRPIEQAEIDKCKAAGIEFIELPIAFDGLSIVINPENTFVDKLSVEELKKIWSPDTAAKNWSDVRAGWPNEKINLFGPGTDSGTFDYFTKAVVGKEKSSRPDYMASEDDNVLVQGVAGDKNGLGYFGFAYYDQNKDKLKVVPIDNGKGPIAPSMESIADGTYNPLSRPLFIYVSKKSLEKPAVKAFVDFYLANVGKFLKEVGYVGLPDASYVAVKKHFDDGKAGSLFSGQATVGMKIEDILAKETAGN